ncbi:prepilin-type N-terminal cleavage/methylation domain-containing protein [Candidatus Woesebacteria bacterium]|nr:prepilin-type N-terminal cleavage/methylation domain-containing protein [Candidatus Woesebacteria bacterium]
MKNVFHTDPMQNKINGFSLIEFVLVTSILGILFLILLFYVPKYTSQAKDSRAKAHLGKVRTVLEDYYNDNKAYPTFQTMSSCEGEELSPYLDKMVCEEQNKPYAYVVSDNGQCYAIFTSLRNSTDQEIGKLGCESGCGPGNMFNFGVSNVSIH